MNSKFCINRNVLTEKASVLYGKNCYVFMVDNDVNKIDIKNCISKTFGVDVKAVNTVNILTKKSRKYTKNGAVDKKIEIKKKAYVYLKPGQELDLNKLN